MGEDIEAPILRIEIDDARPMLGRDIARIVDRLSIAFDQAEKAEPVIERAQLHLVNLYRGTIVIELAALAVSAASFVVAAATLSLQIGERRKRVRRFVVRLRHSSDLILDQGTSGNAAIDNFFRAAAGPIEAGDARRLMVGLHGDNDDPFLLTQEVAETGLAKMRSRRSIAADVAKKQVGRRSQLTADKPVPVGIGYRIAPISIVAGQWIATLPELGGVRVPARLIRATAEELEGVTAAVGHGETIFEGGKPVAFRVDRTTERQVKAPAYREIRAPLSDRHTIGSPLLDARVTFANGEWWAAAGDRDIPVMNAGDFFLDPDKQYDVRGRTSGVGNTIARFWIVTVDTQ